jgi:tryptophan-rich sensory protein
MQIHSDPHSTPSFRKGLFPKVIISIVLITALGTLSGWSTSGSISGWYQEIEKPFFTPPNWLFGPAWLTLYILIGITFGRLWQLATKNRYPIIRNYAAKGMWIFGVHFLLNLVWTPLFFGLQMPGLALIIILILLGLILFMIKHYLRIDRIAAFLLIPYALWVAFATALNFSIWVMN